MRVLTGHFDGKQIRLDQPYALESNARLLITVLPGPGMASEEEADWHRLSMLHLNNAYGEAEPDYPAELVKEVNLEYEGR